MMSELEIKIELLKRGISGAEISRRIGCHRTAIYHVIAGRYKSRRVRQAVAEALNLPYEVVWGKEKNAA